MSTEALHWVLKYSEATLGSRLVLISLANYAHDDGSNAFPSVETLVRHTRMSRRAVQVALRRLETDGAIEPMGKTRSGTTIYQLHLGGADTAPGGAQILHGGAQNLHGGGEVRASASGAESAPKPLTKTVTSQITEPVGFTDWLAAHCDLTGQTMPGALTKGRRDLARTFGQLVGEGRSIEDMTMASLGAWSDAWLRRNDKVFPRNILVANRIDELIAKGRRATPASAGEQFVRTKAGAPEDELF